MRKARLPNTLPAGIARCLRMTKPEKVTLRLAGALSPETRVVVRNTHNVKRVRKTFLRYLCVQRRRMGGLDAASTEIVSML